jgi:hypothetical protein
LRNPVCVRPRIKPCDFPKNSVIEPADLDAMKVNVFVLLFVWTVWMRNTHNIRLVSTKALGNGVNPLLNSSAFNWRNRMNLLR